MFRTREFPDGSYLDFESEGHDYTLFRPEHGETTGHPSVSHIASFEPGKPPPVYVPGAAERGEFIHRIEELDELGDMDPNFEASLEGTIWEQFLIAWRDWRERAHVEPVEIECLLWAEMEGQIFVGQTDRIYAVSNGQDRVLDLFDLKTSPRKSKSHSRQVAAYAYAYEQRFGVEIAAVATVHLCQKDGRVRVETRYVDDRAKALTEFQERLEILSRG